MGACLYCRVSLFLAALFLACGNINAQNSGSVNLPASTAVGIGLGAAANFRISHDLQWRDYEDLVIIATLNRFDKISTNANQHPVTGTFLVLINQLRPILDARSPNNPIFPDETAIVRYAIDSLLQSSASLNSNPVLLAALARLDYDKFTKLEPQIDAIPQSPAELPLYTSATAAYGFIADELQDSNDLAHNDPNYASAINSVLRDLTALDATNSYSDIQQLYPNATPNLPPPNSDGSFTLDSDFITNQYCGQSLSPNGINCQSQSVIGRVELMIDNDLNDLQAFALAQVSSPAGRLRKSDFPGLGRAQAKKPTSLAATLPSGACNLPLGAIGPVAPADLCTKTPDSWSEAQSLVTSLSKLAGFTGFGLTGSPQIATEIMTAGNAVIQMGKAIDTLDTLIDNGGALFGSLSSTLGVLGPAGEIVSAGAAIFSLLGGSSTPNPNAAVIQGLQKLSTQIANLQTFVGAQFMQVDAKLNTILTTLNTDFATVSWQLGAISGDVHQVQIGLLNVNTQLSQLEQYTSAFFQAQENDQLMLDRVQYLNFAFGDIGSSNYNAAEAAFTTWSMTNAADAIWAPTLFDFTDAGIYSAFEAFPNDPGVCSTPCPTPFAVDINYLAQFPAANLHLQQGALTTSPVPLANPDEWMLGARSYLELAHQWPQYAAVVPSSVRLEPIIQVGQMVQQAGQTINTTNTGPNFALFSGLESKYTNAINGFQTAIQTELGTYVGNLVNQQALAQKTSLDLWAGIDQTTGYMPPSLIPPGSITPAFGSPLALQLYGNDLLFLPAGLSAVIPNSIKLLDELGLAQLHLWYTIMDTAHGGPCTQFMGPECDIATPDLNASASCPSGQGKPRSIRIVGTMLPGSVQVPPNNYVFIRDGSFCAQDGVDTVRGGDNTCTGTITTGLANCWQPTIADWQGDVNGIRSAWVANSTAKRADLVGPSVFYWEQVLTNTLDADQQRFYAQLAADLSNQNGVTPVQLSGQELTGAKHLLQAYSSIGLPQSLQTNNVLHSVLFGPNAISEAADVDSVFISFAAQPPPVTVNLAAQEVMVLNAQLSNVSSIFTAALTDIQASLSPDSLPELTTTIQDLQSFKALKDAAAISTSTCLFGVTADAVSVSAGGGNVSVGVNVLNVLNSCTWTANSGAAWLQFPSGSAGHGSGSLVISATANNTGTARMGVVVVGDELFRIFQSAASSSPPQVLTSAVSISSTGLLYSRASLTFNGTLTIKNTGVKPVVGPIEVVVVGLPSGVTMADASGFYNGSPYVIVQGLSSLAPGASASVPVQFSDPSNVRIEATFVAYSGVL
jgi:hypothetical protein